MNESVAPCGDCGKVRIMARGSVLWFCAERGYGFIRPAEDDDVGPGGERELFVPAAAVKQAGLPGLSEGDHITNDVTLSCDGQPFATSLNVT